MASRVDKQMLAPGAKAPAFKLRGLNGEENSLDEMVAAGPALLVFFKASCPTCQFTLPFLERISTGSLRVIGISQDDAEATEEFRGEFGVRFPSLLDDADKNYPVSNAYQISYVPSMFLVETDGRISWAQHGFLKSELEELGRRAGVAPFRDNERVPESKAG